MSVAIEARDLVKTYPAPGKATNRHKGKTRDRRIAALDGLSLTVPRGAIYALLGPNGAGKTTTVKVLTTLARPDSGAADVEGVDVLASPARARRAIGVVAQRSGADPMATGRENLILQGHLYGLTGQDARRRAGELLSRFRLGDAADRFVRTYSGGMLRRLDVALGLMHQPTVLFLDEPTTGLDPESRTALWQEITRLAAADSMTVLLTTHYLEEADRLAHRVAIVDDGKIVAEGEPGQLKDELKGDVVRVEVPGQPGERAVRDTLADVPGIRDVFVAGADDAADGRSARQAAPARTYVSARSDDGAAAVPAVLAALAAAGLPAAAVTVARPSLDEVYLRYTGRRYSEQAEVSV